MTNPDALAEIVNKKLPDWQLFNNVLHRKLSFKSASGSLAFTNHIATTAEQQQHHPSVFIDGAQLQIELYTHDTGGITEKDFVLAEEINTLIKNYTHGMVHEK